MQKQFENMEIKTKQNTNVSGSLNEAMLCAEDKMQVAASAVFGGEQRKLGQTTRENDKSVVGERENSVANTAQWLLKNYTTLKIDESEGYFIIRNVNEGERFLLKSEDFQEFLSHNGCHVRHLILNPLMDIEIFQNLRILKCTLRYKRIEDFLQTEIVEQLKSLENLELKEINMECGAAVLNEQTVANLLKLKNLKHLNLDYFFAAKIQYELFLRLIFEMPLQSLEGNLEVLPTTTNRIENRPIYLHTLQISTTLQDELMMENLSTIFRNLTELNLKFIDTACEQCLQILANCCNNLKKLQFNGSNFKTPIKFPLPPTLEELHLKWCRGITLNNLQEILTQNKIKEFTSSNTNFEGTFQNFQISNTIQILKIDRLDMCDFAGAYTNNNNLKHLTWYHSKHCSLERSTTNRIPSTITPTPPLAQAACLELSEELEDLDYTETTNGIVRATHLATCHNLINLDMGYKNQMSLEILVQLPQLRKLNTWIMDTTIRQWSYIMALLRHPPLEELTLSFVRTINATAMTASFVTNVTILKLQEFNYNDSWLAFFLELFAHNPKLRLQLVLPPLAFVKPLRTLINHRKFPQDLKTIEIYGFQVDCNELRHNFYPTMKKVKYVEPMNYITLIRESNDQMEN